VGVAVRNGIPRGFAGLGGSPCGDKVTAATAAGGVPDGGGVPARGSPLTRWIGADDPADDGAGANP
jgi:hypothetical protein